MKLQTLILTSLIFFFSNNCKAQNEKFKALYIYNITKYVDWPSESEGDNFVIGVYGSSDIIVELNTIAKKRKINEQSVIVKKCTTIDELAECQVVYIPSSKSSYLSSFSSKTKKNILIITEKTGMASKGAGINFVEVEGVLKFEINTSNITKYGLSYNSELLNFGTTVK